MPFDPAVHHAAIDQLASDFAAAVAVGEITDPNLPAERRGNDLIPQPIDISPYAARFAELCAALHDVVSTTDHAVNNATVKVN